MKRKDNAHWYQQTVLYQIYPLSFADSNGDGFGDLQGIIDHLDYLNGSEDSLGIGAIWISPIFRSPMADWGYDVADYEAVDPRFGDLATLDHLIAEAHSRDIKVLLDFVPNHTSIEHPWFVEARSSKTAAKHDWYIWADPKPDGSTPNNWLSRFGGSAWMLDSLTGQYYLHTFLPEQPDLNWRNEEVRAAMLNVLRFWLKRGIDGFRTDAVVGLVKDRQLRDDPPNPNYEPGRSVPTEANLRTYSAGQMELPRVLGTFCDVLAADGDNFLISEVYLGVQGLEAFYRACDRHPLHAPFNFNLMSLEWSARVYQDFLNKYERSLRPNDLPNYVLGNHDRARLASRTGQERARLLAFLQLTLRGLPVIYYGDELGLEDVVIKPGQERDPVGGRVPGHGLGRDGARAPLPWTSAVGRGFTTGAPWLPFPPDSTRLNVETERADHTSLWQLYQRLIKLRQQYPELATGAYTSIEAGTDILAYRRGQGTRRWLAVLNFSHHPVKPSRLHAHLRYVAGTHYLQPPHSDWWQPYEGRLYQIGDSR